ncbi:GerAB/ArcD/ProY family transporter [Neobacillus drentensis]|uniref:GerAB/ArcD/ProY family transporter n=1 Tax=Neobacillus drentensis TaxID=220684 RepID=UPI00082545C0|nr:GerAB/ArcD/ProY family transporter [Neobacillus drentensis]
MKQQLGKLGLREYISIAILMVGAKATEDTPIHLFSKVQNASWMIPILSAGIFFIPLFLLLKTMTLFQDKDLFSVIQKLLGKYLGFMVCLLIFLISSYAISFDTRSYANIIRTFYFTTTPNLIIYALLMVVCTYGARKGIQHIGSVAYLVIYLSVFSLWFALVLCTQKSTFQAIFPIWGPGKLEILKQSSQKLTLFADFFLFTMLIPFLTSIKQYKKGTWFAFVYVSLQISVAILIYICLFDVGMDGLAYPFHTAIRFISIGSFLPNVEIIFFVTWLMSAFIRFTAFLYLNSLMFGHLFKIKDFEYVIPSLATIYLLIGSIPEAAVNASTEFKALSLNISGPAFAAISIILWLAALLKGEFKREKNRNSM